MENTKKTKWVRVKEYAKLERDFGFMGEEWLGEMRGYIRRKIGLDD